MEKLALCAAFCHQMAQAVPAPGELGNVIVETEQGLVRGRIRNIVGDDNSKSGGTAAVAEYLGIPFAQPPLGQGRFAPPRPPKTWEGVHDATQFKHNCIQGSMNMGWPQPMSTQSEDWWVFFSPVPIFTASTSRILYVVLLGCERCGSHDCLATH